ncbi:sigma 54-interacting transcriptional regulator [Bombilactobacillus folatiphilus]|uniref:Sigma 54-interacting transcriptional regulator n=1 Tax=Bombilactobacillus folatiphilus TaxID=2923362 RepID=A0ABY4P951_9LACO|nr:sigma 54-interacting transcriptional regulator [Bombilactobacillus folatiphilus]UQS82265.1 sigma 54-interacting transcriptional regulator [Bombilactobacillus folatiphilus]
MLLDQIELCLKEATADEHWQQHEISAAFLCQKFRVKRNTVSHYLNLLFKDHKALKINSRPVIYWDKRVLETHYQVRLLDMYPTRETLLQALAQSASGTNAFDQVIGNRGSLYIAIERLKMAASYPQGLSILLTGPTGVGKSFLAQVYYQYCLDQGYLASNAQFVHFNCAEYADNPELLASNLFGYNQGAFTGASTAQTGVFDQANHGVLFLDEVHRLDAKGQEKLFNYLDTGYITPLGGSSKRHLVDVRIICATTENLQSYFLDTFLRRIPIQIEIPSLQQRELQEVKDLIKFFYWQQAQQLQRNLQVHQAVIKVLCSIRYQGNIGSLKNAIVLSVASAIHQATTLVPLKITLPNLPPEILNLNSSHAQVVALQTGFLDITVEQTLAQLITKEPVLTDEIQQTIQQILNDYHQMQYADLFIENSIAKINKLCDYLVFEKDQHANIIPLNFFKNLFENVLATITKDQNIDFTGNTALILSYYFYNRQDSNGYLTGKQARLAKKVVHYFQALNANLQIVVETIDSIITQSVGLAYDLMDAVFLYIFLYSIIQKSQTSALRCIVLAHGYSTASSIVNVVNGMHHLHILDAIDMPVDIQIATVGQKINHYIQNHQIDQGLILMVDMGSLEGVQKYIARDVEFPIAILNNVSTQAALLVATGIQQKQSLPKIMTSVKKQIQPEQQMIYPQKVKKNLIITCCLTGIGTATKIRKLVLDSLPANAHLSVLAFEESQLKDSQELALLRHVYNIVMVIGTMDPQLPQIPYFSLESMISGADLTALTHVLSQYLSEQELNDFNDRLIHNFTLQRVLNSITILDVNVVMQNIDEAFKNYTQLSGQRLSSGTRMTLYVHVSYLVERLIRNEPITTYNWDSLTDTKSLTIFQNIQKAFSVIETEYSVTIPQAEYGYIYDIIAADTVNQL